MIALLEVLLVIAWLEHPDPNLVLHFPRRMTEAEIETLWELQKYCGWEGVEIDPEMYA